jgi:hypothetical protein
VPSCSLTRSGPVITESWAAICSICDCAVLFRLLIYKYVAEPIINTATTTPAAIPPDAAAVRELDVPGVGDESFEEDTVVLVLTEDVLNECLDVDGPEVRELDVD